MQRKIRIDRPANCRFDEPQANRAIDFFQQHLVHTKGRRWANKPFIPADWQAIDLREIFGRVDDEGNRIVRIVYKEIPKKNGKSEEAAGVALKLLFADDEPGAEVYGAAADREQASIVFNVAVEMVERSRELSSIAKCIPSTKRIINPGWGVYRAISAEVAGKHGFNSHGVIFDEVHAQETMRLWEVLTFGAGAARTQPLVYAITTAGVPGESPVAEMLHELADQVLRGIIPCPPSFYPICYAAPEDANWQDEEVWYGCNPALGDFLSIESVREEYDRARRHASEQNSFRRLRLNQWVRQITRWIDMGEWDSGGICTSPAAYREWVANEIRELRNFAWYGGLDLSSKLDVTAFLLVCLDGNGLLHVLPNFWVPKENLRDRPNMEGEKYRVWVEQGFLNACEGAAVNYESMRQRIIELGREVRIQQIVFDPKFSVDIAQRLGPAGDGFELLEMTQGFNGYTPPCIELETALSESRVRHGGHPMLRWMADCVEIQERGDGAKRPVKPERKKSGKRIDGIVALLMAMSRAMLLTDQNVISFTKLRTIG